MRGMSRPARGGWIEMLPLVNVMYMSPSRPARGGWIEIRAKQTRMSRMKVPPRKGRVD